MGTPGQPKDSSKVVPGMPTLDIGLHPKQAEIFFDPAKIRIVCAARRFGKSRMVIWDALVSALGYSGKVDPVSPAVILLTEPTRTQANGILWKPLVDLCETHPAIVPHIRKINRVDYRIDFKYGKPSIVVAGVNDKDGDGIRGKRIYRFYGDEWQSCKPGVLDTIILPAMADTEGSRALLTFTPKGRLNHTYELIQRAESDPATYRYFHATTADNPFVPRAEIDRARLSLPPRIFRQEFEGSLEDFAGKVFTELSSDNYCDATPDCQYYFLGVDWGESYPAVVALGLSQGTWVYLEGWQGNHETPGEPSPVPQPTFEAEILRLARKYAVDGVFCDPSRPSSILGLRSLGTQHGIPGLTKARAGYNRIADGISQVHSLIFQKKLLVYRGATEALPGVVNGSALFRLLEAYHYATDKAGNVTEKIEEGQPDHILDALRYCIAVPSGSP